MDDAPLTGLTVGITAERKAEEQASMLRARGAATLWGPTLRVFTIADDQELRAATEDVIRRPPDFLLASTGFGMRTWLSAAEAWGLRPALLEALVPAKVVNRGAKAASANNAAGLPEWWRAPDERFDEVLDRVLAEPLAGSRIVVQVHGMPAPRAVARLTEAGADVIVVDGYRASLPSDTGPASALLDAACSAALAAITFTTAPAVHNLFVLADAEGRSDELRAALNGPVVAACVGPVCAEGAIEEGVAAPLVPSRSRLVPLIQTLTEHLAATSGA